MEIRCDRVLLRPWRRGDEEALVRYANNRNVWRNLRDRFPNPYTMADAEAWIRRNEGMPEPTTSFAIVLGGEPVGAIGLERRQDVDRRTPELGYWLGEPFWGRGLATEAARAVADYAFAMFDVERLEAGVFEWNPASGRVLEKAGFHFEARLVKAVFKDGRLIDRLLYARFRTGSVHGEDDAVGGVPSGGSL
jgi:RimJ/RimL family protein N-acetyltransferase